MMSKKSPQLRFEGFTDDWEQSKLTDITSSYSGLTYSPTDVQDKGTFVLRSSNVKNDQLIDADNVYVNPDIVNSNNVKVGDVIVVVRNGSRSLIGKHAIVTKEMPHTVIGAFMSAFRGENGDYINALLSTNNFQKEVHKSLGATINQITGKDFSMMNFQTPKLEEQNKIGSFFKQLDNTIALHQRKLDLLKEQKKGFLQKMFPKNGEKVPELRFAGFADDWEERKLSELIQKGGSGGTPKSTNKTYYDGDIPFLGISDISKSNGYIDDTEKHISEKGLNNSSAWIVPKGAISLAMYASVGKLAILNIDAATSQAFYNMVFEYESIRDYVYHRLGRANDLGEWTKLISTGTQANLNADKVKNFEIQVPQSIDEMKDISTFFNQLDIFITLHQRKLDLLKEQKKGFLQKMFV